MSEDFEVGRQMIKGIALLPFGRRGEEQCGEKDRWYAHGDILSNPKKAGFRKPALQKARNELRHYKEGCAGGRLKEYAKHLCWRKHRVERRRSHRDIGPRRLGGAGDRGERWDDARSSSRGTGGRRYAKDSASQRRAGASD